MTRTEVCDFCGRAKDELIVLTNDRFGIEVDVCRGCLEKAGVTI